MAYAVRATREREFLYLVSAMRLLEFQSTALTFGLTGGVGYVDESELEEDGVV